MIAVLSIDVACDGISLSFAKKSPSADAPCFPNCKDTLSKPFIADVVDCTKVFIPLLANPPPPLPLPPPLRTLFIALPVAFPAAARLPSPCIVLAMFSFISGAPDNALRNSTTASDNFLRLSAVVAVLSPADASFDSEAMNDVSVASTAPNDVIVVTAFFSSGVSFFIPSAVFSVLSPALASRASEPTKLFSPLLTSPMLAMSLIAAAIAFRTLTSNFDVSVLTSLCNELVNFSIPESLIPDWFIVEIELATRSNPSANCGSFAISTIENAASTLSLNC